MIARRFGSPGDVQAAQSMVASSTGIQRTRDLAAEHAAAAVAAVSDLLASPALFRLDEWTVDQSAMSQDAAGFCCSIEQIGPRRVLHQDGTPQPQTADAATCPC